MTDNELKEIEAREKAATPGPWYMSECCDMCGGTCTRFGDSPTEEEELAGRRRFNFIYNGNIMDNHKANDEFIAASRQDIPNLIAALREARESFMLVKNDLNIVREELYKLRGGK